MSAKKFRFCAQRAIFTYSTGYMDKERLRQFLESKCPVVSGIIVHEHESHDHTHAVVEFEHKFESRNVRIFDFEQDGQMHHPNIKTLPNRKAYADGYNYTLKQDEDPYCWGTAPTATMLEAIHDCQDLQQAITRYASGPTHQLQYIQQIITAWQFKPEDESDKIDITLRPWQEEALTYLSQPTGRVILWVYDKIGGAGKSTFCEWLVQEFRDDYAVVGSMGGVRDAATILQSEIERGWKMKGLLVDLPRAAEQKAIYEPFEAVKSGRITVTKYRGQSLKLKREMALIVFANFLPNIHAMSLDRWDIMEISRDGFSRLTLKDVERMRETDGDDGYP